MKLINTDGVTIVASPSIVYDEGLRGWVVEGDGVYSDPDKLLRIPPQSVSMRQARLALLAAGLLDTVDAAITAAGGVAKIEWEYATEVERDSTLVAQMGAVLGLDDAAVDALFVAAGRIV